MKCSFCTFNHTPETLPLLKMHAHECMVEGRTNGLTPVVVWREGSFVLVAEAEEGEQVYATIDPLPEPAEPAYVEEEAETVEE
jgi:hypothetical protein